MKYAHMLSRIAGTLALFSALPQSATAQEGIIRHDFEVTTVDPTALQEPNEHTAVPNRHIALVPQHSTARKKRLFLFVTGTNISETTQQEIIYAGARRGYHTLVVAYPNYDAVVATCAGNLDNNCSGKMREEILTGADVSPVIAINPQDAFETRLRNLLVYLRENQGNEGWGRFIKNGAVDWSQISAAGHSQGAGHVAMLAKRHSLYRAVMISGVADLSLTGQPAPWLYGINRTPVERQYAYTHVLDYVVPIVLAEASWDAIGLDEYGPTQSVDDQQPDYMGSHRLKTARLPKSGANPHVAMLDDRTMTRETDGSPAHLPVWNLIIFP